jgi:hypothetical protein
MNINCTEGTVKASKVGGVLLAINKNFISDEVEELHPGNDCEIIWAKLEIKGSKTLYMYISSFYNPKTSDEKSLKFFDISVRRASQIKNAALFTGGNLGCVSLLRRPTTPTARYSDGPFFCINHNVR